MIIDAHTHLGLERFIVKPISAEKRAKPAFKDKIEATVEMLIARMDANGVTRSVAFPHPLEEVDADAANRYVMDAHRAHPDRIIPFALIGDNVEYWLAQGAKGFKQHEILQAPERFDLPRAYRTMADANAPLIIHARSPRPGMVVDTVRNILQSAPSLRVIIAHMGRHTPNTSEHVLGNLEAFRTDTNVYFESSTVRDPEIFRRAIDLVGEDRLLFGTDFPFNSYLDADPTSVEIRLMERAGLDSRVLQKVLGENILHFWAREEEVTGDIKS